MSLNKKLLLPLLFGGGALRPASVSDIQQWLRGVEPDGISIIDKKDIVNPEPEVRDVNVLNFTGTEFVDFADVAGVDYPYTMSAWLKTTTNAVGVAVSLANTAGGGGSDMSYIGTDVDGYAVAIRRDSLIFAEAQGTTIITDGAWHRVVGYFTSATSCSIEVDGDIEDVDTTSVLIQNLIKPAIGRESGTTPGQNFVGQISDASIDILGRYPLEEGISLPFDISGNENHATANTATWTTADEIPSLNHRDGFFRTVTTADADIPTFTILGDSLTSQNADGYENPVVATSEKATTLGYFNWARTYLSGQCKLLGNDGVGGETSTQILARVGDVTAKNPDYCIVCAGSNDSTGAIDVSTVSANYDSINTALEAAGITVIWMTVTPRGDNNAAMNVALESYNTYIKATFPNVADIYSAIDDGTGTGTPTVGSCYDDPPIHWSERGAEAVGRIVAPVIENLTSLAPFEWHDTTHSCNFLTNPTLANNGLGWSKIGGLGVFSASDEYGGNKSVQTTTNPDFSTYLLYEEPDSSGLWSSGDTLRLAADISWSNIDSDYTDKEFYYPYCRVTQKDIGDGTLKVTSALGLPTDELIAGMPGVQEGRSVVLTPEITVDAAAVVLEVYVGFDQVPAGSTVTVNRVSGWNTVTAASEVYPYVPALADGSAAANGNLITNPGGYVHNDFEGTLIQTDPDETVFGGVCFYTADAATWDKKTKAEYEAQYLVNGSFNLWVKKRDDNIYEAVQYLVSKEFTPAENNKNETYFGGTSAALRDVDGELILDGSGFVIYTA